MKRPRDIREVLDALEWARIERMRVGSPDFVRARVIEQSVQQLCDRMAKGMAELPKCRTAEWKDKSQRKRRSATDFHG